MSRKAKVSFLFGSKEAYKVDDELIYTLCMKGVEELQSEFPELKGQLEHYKDDMFHESAKEFYRGSQTKEVLETIDTKMKHLVTMISPYFMHSACHKVLEFLIRVYEVQAYHKTHVFFSFLPFYDTPQYLRLLQCLELKSDSMLLFFEPFAEKGVKLSLEALVKFMSREDGAYLNIFSEIAFKYLTLRDEQSVFINKSEEHETGLLTTNFATVTLGESGTKCVPHFRFWGTLVSKILASEIVKKSESLLYVLIPYIAKALDSQVEELQIGALSIVLSSLDSSLLAKRIPFSEEYMNAFLTEICKSASKSLIENGDSQYFNICVKACIRILHAQQAVEKVNDRLSTFSYNANSSKYEIQQSKNEQTSKKGEVSFKWIGDLLANFEKLILICSENSHFDLTPIIFKCLEFYLSNDEDTKGKSRQMIKILATQTPSAELYKLVMAYLFVVIGGHLPECQSKENRKFAVLVLDYLESRDSFTYVQTLDILLQGRSEKHKILDLIEEIEVEEMGKAKKKVVTIDTGVSSQKESVPVLLALYHKKNAVKKAALLSLYEKWIEQEDITEGKDLRMIASMLIQYIEEREQEDVLIVTFTLLEHLISKGLLSEALSTRLYESLTNEFIPGHFPPDRQYSIAGYMKGVSLTLQIQGSEYESIQSLIYLVCSINDVCKPLMPTHKFAK